MRDRIENSVDLKEPVAKVWHALTDYREFGQWFRVTLEKPFIAGQSCRGKIAYPGYEHLTWEVVVHKIEPQKLFSFTWHPYAVDPKVDYSQETPTLVEFFVEKIEGGSRVRVVESGFSHIPAHRREEALRMNEGGWAEQMKNIRNHLS